MAEVRPVFHPEIGQFFTGLRESKGWTQRQAEDIAERKKLTALTRQVLWRLEKGKVKNIDPKVLRALAELYQMSYVELVGRWTTHRYGVDIARARDLTRHEGDQGSALPKGGSDVSASAAQARIQQLEQQLLDRDLFIAKTQEIAMRLYRLYTVAEENRGARTGESGGRRARGKTG